jgi:hypothetical protein
MKYVKMLGLLAVAAAALMAFAGSASATTVTSPTGTHYTGTIEATSEKTPTYLTGLWSDVECELSHVKGKIEVHGDAVTAEGKIENLSFTNCNYPVTVISGGSLIAHATAAGATLTSKNAIVDVHTSVGRCRFATGAGVHIGELTDSHTTKETATLHINNSSIPVTEGSFFCGSSGEWEGSYEVTNPMTLYID